MKKILMIVAMAGLLAACGESVIKEPEPMPKKEVPIYVPKDETPAPKPEAKEPQIGDKLCIKGAMYEKKEYGNFLLFGENGKYIPCK